MTSLIKSKNGNLSNLEIIFANSLESEVIRLSRREKNKILGELTKQQYCTVSRGWRVIGGKRCYFKSKWEANYARYLENLKKIALIDEWEYEPQTFYFEKIKSGTRSYKPDFRILKTVDGKSQVGWVEVKGYMKHADKTKISRFRKYYPENHLMVVGGEFFKDNATLLRCLPEYEA